MQEIYFKKTLLGIKITRIPKGSIPQTRESGALQLVTLKHPAKTILKAHKHVPKKRVTQRLQECLVVKTGKIRVDLYNLNDKLVKHVYLTAGQIFISVSGGIGIKFIKDSEIFEFKNGPFIEDKLLIETNE
jgi:hypothetical protein